MSKSRVALRTIFRIAFVVWTSHHTVHVSAYDYVLMSACSMANPIHLFASDCISRGVGALPSVRALRHRVVGPKIHSRPRMKMIEIPNLVRARMPQRKVGCTQVAFEPEDSRGVS